MMKKHKRYAVILSAALALAVIAGCAVNPAEPGGSDNTPDPTPAAADGEYSGGAFGSMEEFFALMDSRNPEQTHEYAAADGGTATAKVEDIRRDIAKVCEIEGLAGDAVIEGYTVESWYDLDVPADEVPLYGDMERDGEYVSFGTTLYYDNGLAPLVRPLKVRSCSKLADATLLATSHWSTDEQKGDERVQKLIDAVKLYRTFGDCFGYFAVASGGADIMIDPDLSYWDIAALLPVVEGAGGTLTSMTGGNPLKDLSAVCTAGGIHGEVIAILNS